MCCSNVLSLAALFIGSILAQTGVVFLQANEESFAGLKEGRGRGRHGHGFGNIDIEPLFVVGCPQYLRTSVPKVSEFGTCSAVVLVWVSGAKGPTFSEQDDCMRTG